MPPNGSRTRTLGSNRMLAEVLRANFHPEYIAAIMTEVIAGRDYRVTLRDIEPSTNKPRPGRPSNKPVVEQIPTLDQSLSMLAHMLLRRDGQPAQQIQLDQTLQARVASLAGSVDLAALAQRPPEERDALRKLLRSIVRKDVEPTQDPAPVVLPPGDPEVPAPVGGSEPADE